MCSLRTATNQEVFIQLSYRRGYLQMEYQNSNIIRKDNKNKNKGPKLRFQLSTSPVHGASGYYFTFFLVSLEPEVLSHQIEYKIPMKCVQNGIKPNYNRKVHAVAGACF